MTPQEDKTETERELERHRGAPNDACDPLIRHPKREDKTETERELEKHRGAPNDACDHGVDES